MKSIKDLIMGIVAVLKEKVKDPFAIVNVIFDIILAIVPLIYGASDVLKQLIFCTMSTLKTWMLGRDITNTYIETSYMLLFMPCIVVTFLCMLYLMWFNAYKNGVFKKK